MKTISICPMIKRTLILLGVMAVLTVFTPAAAETASAPTVVIKIAIS